MPNEKCPICDTVNCQTRIYHHSCYNCGKRWADHNPISHDCPFCDERMALSSKSEDWKQEKWDMMRD
jgi:hypothetical protein